MKVLGRFDDASNKEFNALLIWSVLGVVGTLDKSVQSDFTTIKSRCHIIPYFCDFIILY